ncbi:hypothetical protein DSM106972_014950 [Dulcicalothrix desertica PCC 7102]|uniref:Uncharacterized protein n=1 Tax=Dulcicalothrix desertica PCC 7102 TaxID=232991 RepID=A0A3S1CQ58_9CYAN|nr:hypothetical protein [Dulcicalothrix desertica]RUT08327.1 hypothetical protein DSM106972_014950 [Dulcicalothrix desertica PCC 7102]TWH40191.1 hypothetical protein CAL7102_09495 [Dulcicalothrix desertica PCC 7102]
MHSKTSILNASWDGLDIKYVNTGIPLMEGDSLIVGVVILDNTLEQFDAIHGACIKHMKEYLLFTLSPLRFEQMLDQTIICLNQAYMHQLKITDPSMLHMANLLITEIQYPNPLSQQFIYSIVTVLITNCFLYLKS